MININNYATKKKVKFPTEDSVNEFITSNCVHIVRTRIVKLTKWKQNQGK